MSIRLVGFPAKVCTMARVDRPYGISYFQTEHVMDLDEEHLPPSSIF